MGIAPQAQLEGDISVLVSSLGSGDLKSCPPRTQDLAVHLSSVLSRPHDFTRAILLLRSRFFQLQNKHSPHA